MLADSDFVETGYAANNLSFDTIRGLGHEVSSLLTCDGDEARTSAGDIEDYPCPRTG